MKNVSVKWKMASICLIAIIGLVIISIFTMNSITQMQDQTEVILKQSIENEYDKESGRECNFHVRGCVRKI